VALPGAEAPFGRGKRPCVPGIHWAEFGAAGLRTIIRDMFTFSVLTLLGGIRVVSAGVWESSGTAEGNWAVSLSAGIRGCASAPRGRSQFCSGASE
jgi:hypothetical protein